MKRTCRGFALTNFCFATLSLFILRASGASIASLPYQLSPDLPHDVVAPHAGAAALQPSMDFMSWETFIALCWPASTNENGVPDRNNIVGGYPADPEGGSASPVGPTVWETFKESSDIFLNPPVPPSGFNAPQRVPPDCATELAAMARPRILLMKAKVSDVLDEVTEAFTQSPLIDQNGQDVWYEVRLNEEEFNFIVTNKYYVSTNQPSVITNMPAGSNTGKAAGSMHIKAAWKVMGPNDNTNRFYTSLAYTYDPARTPQCRQQLMGLVGLHIVHKTATRPQWVWATFEQVDNAPTLSTNIPNRHYSFYNPGCPACPINQQTTLASTNPVQVVRITPIPDDKKQLNAQFHAALVSVNRSNVWQYYQLVDTQWPAVPNNPKILGGPVPTFLANTALETYFQGPQKTNDPPHGCINCHGTFAQNQDFLFQFSKAYPQQSKKAK